MQNSPLVATVFTVFKCVALLLHSQFPISNLASIPGGDIDLQTFVQVSEVCQLGVLILRLFALLGTSPMKEFPCLCKIGVWANWVLAATVP